MITISAEAVEVHPELSETMYVYVPVASPVIVLLVPVPVDVTAPGVLVKVQGPVAGSPLNETLPVAIVQFG